MRPYFVIQKTKVAELNARHTAIREANAAIVPATLQGVFAGWAAA